MVMDEPTHTASKPTLNLVLQRQNQLGLFSDACTVTGCQYALLFIKYYKVYRDSEPQCIVGRNMGQFLCSSYDSRTQYLTFGFNSALS